MKLCTIAVSSFFFTLFYRKKHVSQHISLIAGLKKYSHLVPSVLGVFLHPVGTKPSYSKCGNPRMV